MKKSVCPCGSEVSFSACCEPFLEGKSFPDTAEKLMRSRYAAFVTKNLEYIQSTMAPAAKKDFDLDATKHWVETADWKGLKIVSTEKGGPDDTKGMVEFTATYSQNGEGIDHHEVSEFRKDKSGHWLFFGGEAHTHKEGESHHHDAPSAPHVRTDAKVGRNDPCSCGSGKKFKKCCESA